MPVSLHDTKLICLLDGVLAQAIELWSRRPAPQQRSARIGFGEAWCDFRDEIDDEELEALFPEAAYASKTLMRLVQKYDRGRGP